MGMSGRLLSTRITFLVCLLLAAAGCKEEGGVKVTSFTFNGAKAVTPAQLKSVLATSASSRIPWGTKHYFSRDQFDADLKRIVAFYKDRGYPDARITSTDVKLNKDQTSVKLAINIDEGEPVRVERVVFTGFDALPAQHRTVLESKLPLRAGQPLDRALMQASRESALDELRDHGFPYASVRMSEVEGASPKSRVVSLVADPGPLSTFGPIEVVGNTSVGDEVIRRQLAYRSGRPVPAERAPGEPAPALLTRAVRVRQCRAGAQRREASRNSDPRDGHRGKAPAGELRRWLRL